MLLSQTTFLDSLDAMAFIAWRYFFQLFFECFQQISFCTHDGNFIHIDGYFREQPLSAIDIGSFKENPKGMVAAATCYFLEVHALKGVLLDQNHIFGDGEPLVSLPAEDKKVTAMFFLVSQELHVKVHRMQWYQHGQAFFALDVEVVIQVHRHPCKMGVAFNLRNLSCLLVQCAHDYYSMVQSFMFIAYNQQDNMIRKQFIWRKINQPNKIEMKRDVTFSRSPVLVKDQERDWMQRPSILKNRQQTFINRRKSLERVKFQTQPIQFYHDQAKNDESISHLLAKDLDSSFLPMIEDGRNYYQKRRNSDLNNDWVDKLKANHEIKRIYVEESQKLTKDLECWSRIKARMNLLKQIKREKLRLIALYQKQ